MIAISVWPQMEGRRELTPGAPVVGATDQARLEERPREVAPQQPFALLVR